MPAIFVFFDFGANYTSRTHSYLYLGSEKVKSKSIMLTSVGVLRIV